MFAVENGLQSKNQFLHNALEKSYLLRQLTVTIAYKNLILEKENTYNANSVFLPKSTFYNFFPKVNSLKTYFAYFFFGQVEISSGK